MEAVPGEGCVVPAPPAWLRGLTRDHPRPGIPLVVDEIQEMIVKLEKAFVDREYPGRRPHSEDYGKATVTGTSGPRWRVEFDAEVVFSNGGALQAQGFRLDIPGSDIGDEEAGELFVRHLGLLMVGQIKIANKRLIQEPHKGSRGVPVTGGRRRVIDLTAAGEGGTVLAAPDPPVPLSALVDLPVTLVRTLGGGSDTVDRAQLVPFAVTGTAVVVHTGGTARLSGEAGAWLAGQRPALVATDGTETDAVSAVLNAAGVPVVGGLAELERIPPTGTRLHVVPLSTARTPCPVRAYVIADGDGTPPPGAGRTVP